jgi:ketosteroid isomerase-like protein
VLFSAQSCDGGSTCVLTHVDELSRCARSGTGSAGRQQVRAGIQARFDGIPDIHYGDHRHWTCGDRGVSEWTIRGTQATGEPIEVRGCDLFEFTDGKISRKDSFWKIVD